MKNLVEILTSKEARNEQMFERDKPDVLVFQTKSGSVSFTFAGRSGSLNLRESDFNKVDIAGKTYYIPAGLELHTLDGLVVRATFANASTAASVFNPIWYTPSTRTPIGAVPQRYRETLPAGLTARPTGMSDTAWAAERAKSAQRSAASNYASEVDIIEWGKQSLSLAFLDQAGKKYGTGMSDAEILALLGKPTAMKASKNDWSIAVIVSEYLGDLGSWATTMFASYNPVLTQATAVGRSVAGKTGEVSAPQMATYKVGPTYYGTSERGSVSWDYVYRPGGEMRAPDETARWVAKRGEIIEDLALARAHLEAHMGIQEATAQFVSSGLPATPDVRVEGTLGAGKGTRWMLGSGIQGGITADATVAYWEKHLNNPNYTKFAPQELIDLLNSVIAAWKEVLKFSDPTWVQADTPEYAGAEVATPV